MIDLTPIRQSDDSQCGPASIKIILLYYGIDATEKEIAERCGHTYEDGCNDEGMKKAIESYGLGAVIKNNSTLEDLEYWMKFKIPVIVDWISGGVTANYADTPNGHASIVVDIDKNSVYLLDPEFGIVRCIGRVDFMRMWFDFRTPHITCWEDLITRQMIIVYPLEFENLLNKK